MSQIARTDADHLFEPVLEYPDEQHQARFDQLVGMGSSKDGLVKEMLIRLDPDQLRAWSRTQHGEVLPVTSALLDRPPVFTLAGDVGTGKTALAESVGDPVARALGIPVFAYRLSLAARGSGLVGEITTLVRDAFATVGEQARRAARGDGKARSAFILVIDEADALAQSRDNGQMHHEDRAGVNALIRGIDEFARDRLPSIVILCTNRLEAIDPAVQRRSAAPLLFNRPDEQQRKNVLTSFLTGLDVPAEQLDELVALTGARGSQPGYTYSDLTQRLAPAAVLAAFPDKALTVDAFVHAVATTPATPPFGAGGTNATSGGADDRGDIRVSGSTSTATTTNPFGVCFVSYRRARQAEVGALVRALHELGVPTWQDLDDLDEQPLEATLRTVLADPNTASGVLWVTPEVAHSTIITHLEVPGLTARAASDPIFALVPVAAGGLDYAEAAAAARSATTLVDLTAWSIGKVAGDPATVDDVVGVAQRVLRRRVRAVHAHLPAGGPFVIDVFTRAPGTRHPDAALTVDFTHLFDGRSAKRGTWDRVTTSLRTVFAQVAKHAPGRPVHVRGLLGLPTAVTLGTVASAPSGVDAAWAQHTPGRADALYTVGATQVPSLFIVDLADGNAGATDVAVLVSVSENVVPAFQATSGLGPFRGMVTATAPAGHPHMFDSPGQAVDLAHDVVRKIREARSRYGTVGVVHLFIAGPAGLAFVIGQLLNTWGAVTTYDHVSATGTGTYAPAVTLKPSH